MNYPRWWNTTITLYNRYEEKETNLVTWRKTIIDGCFLKNANNKVSVGQTVLETNEILVRIPESDKFKPYGEMISDVKNLTGDYFTLNRGDIIIKGAVDDDIDEYAKGKKSTDLLSKYKEIGVCLQINNWQDNTGVGRVAPHYYVSGE
ncbi:MAG: hypothetical protein J1F01_05665 [Oscillospiraceae bacterium]|nr:hypothetical protein [Oscillospiraceae bacterium]